MSGEQEYRFGDYDDSFGTVQPPDYAGAEPCEDYIEDLRGQGISWEFCEETLDSEEPEEAEILLDHDEDTAFLLPDTDADELEESYDEARYQVMGRRRPEPAEDEYEWEPVRDLSGPSDLQKMGAHIVAGTGVAGFQITKAGFKTVFEILSAAAR